VLVVVEDVLEMIACRPHLADLLAERVDSLPGDALPGS